MVSKRKNKIIPGGISMLLICFMILLMILGAVMPFVFIIFWVTTMNQKKTLEKKLHLLQQNLKRLYETGQISSEAYHSALDSYELPASYPAAQKTVAPLEEEDSNTETPASLENFQPDTEVCTPSANFQSDTEVCTLSANFQPDTKAHTPLSDFQLDIKTSVSSNTSTLSDSLENTERNASFVSGQSDKTFIPTTTKHKKLGETLALSLGVLFIFLAGIIFSVSNWQTWGAFEKTGIILLASAVCFGCCVLSKKCFSLTLTSKAFYGLGSILFMLTFYALGLYHLLGRYLSPDGNAASLYFLCIFILELCLVAGYFLFHDTLYKVLGAIGLTLSVIWANIAFAPSVGVAAVFLCAFGTLSLSVSFLYFKKSRFLQRYSLFNLCISGFSFFLYYIMEQEIASYDCLLQSVCLLLLAVSFFALNISDIYAEFKHVTSSVSVSLFVSAMFAFLSEIATGIFPFLCLFTFFTFAMALIYVFHIYCHKEENAPKCFLSMTTGYGFACIACHFISVMLLFLQLLSEGKFSFQSMLFAGIFFLIYVGFHACIRKFDLADSKHLFECFKEPAKKIYAAVLLLFFYTMTLFYFGMTLGKISCFFTICIGIGILSLAFVLSGKKGEFLHFAAFHGGNIYLLFLFVSACTEPEISIWSLLLLCAYTAFYGYLNQKKGNMVYAALEQFNLVIFVLAFSDEYGILNNNYGILLFSVLTLLVLGLGYFFRPQLNETPSKNNWLGICSILWIFSIIINETKYGPFIGMLLLSIYTLSYCSGKNGKHRPILLSIASFFAAVALTIQPLITYPAVLSFELHLVPSFLFWIVFPYPFQKGKEYCDIRDIMIHILLGVLSIHALIVNTAVSAIVLGVIGGCIFLIACYFKNKRYTRMSAILLILLGIYASRDFLHSLGWWIYLLIAGIGFFLFAIIREKKH